MDFDEARLLSAMRDYVAATSALDATGREGEPRVLLDLAEAKLLAGMRLRKALVAQGWVAPVRTSAAT